VSGVRIRDPGIPGWGSGVWIRDPGIPGREFEVPGSRIRIPDPEPRVWEGYRSDPGVSDPGSRDPGSGTPGSGTGSGCPDRGSEDPTRVPDPDPQDRTGYRIGQGGNPDPGPGVPGGLSSLPLPDLIPDPSSRIRIQDPDPGPGIQVPRLPGSTLGCRFPSPEPGGSGGGSERVRRVSGGSELARFPCSRLASFPVRWGCCDTFYTRRVVPSVPRAFRSSIPEVSGTRFPGDPEGDSGWIPDVSGTASGMLFRTSSGSGPEPLIPP